MANGDENNQDTDLEDEQNSEEGDDTNEGSEADTSEDSSEDDADNADDEDSEEDGSKPLSRKDVAAIAAKAVKQALSESRRLADKGKKNGKKPASNSQRDSGPDEETTKRLSNLEVAESKRQFGYDNNLPPNVVDYIFKLNKRPTKEFLKEPFVQAGIEAMRRTDSTRNNIPHGTGRNFSVKGKTFAELDPNDKQANFGALQDSILKGKGRR